MKRKTTLFKSFLLAAGLCVGANDAWGQDPTPIYTQDFESASTEVGTAGSNFGITGATLTGDGAIQTGDAIFGKYYQNMPNATESTKRTNYLTLSTDVFSNDAFSTNKAVTVSFWVNPYLANTKNITSDVSPLIVAYGTGGNAAHGYPFGLHTATAFGAHSSLDGNYYDVHGAPHTGKFTSGTSFADSWHHVACVYTEVENTSGGKNTRIMQYVDGVLVATVERAHNDNGEGGTPTSTVTEMQLLSQLKEIVIGGNAPVWEDPDNLFAYDEIAIYGVALSAAQVNKIIFDKAPASYIVNNKGDLTSIINGDFQIDAKGWSADIRCPWVPTRSWRGESYANYHGEISANGAMSYTLSNMPAGTYKVVAAARAYNDAAREDGTHDPTCGTITPKIAGTSGTALTGVGDIRNTLSGAEINTNGVEMPYSSLGGFTGDYFGHNWRWISATGTLNETGNLVISFDCVGAHWMAIDDVHLYYVSDAYSGHTATTTYCMSANNVSENMMINLNNNTRSVTCDITKTNPNAIIRTSSQVTTASGEYLDNNKHSTTAMTKLVLYDGYSYTDYTDNNNVLTVDNGCILYRTIPANTWCTLVVPFLPNNLDVKKVPSSIADGVLSFEDAPSKDVNNEPMLVKSTVGVTAITGTRASSADGAGYGDMISGAGVLMKGTYSTISNIYTLTGDDTRYVVARDNDADALYKVNSTVSLAPFRAYFSIPEDSPVKANVIALNFGDTATGIAEIENGEVKAIVNGPIYNLAGQRVDNSQFTIHNSQLKRGIYIVGGKKVLVK